MLEQILEEVLLLHFVFVSFFNYHIICVAIGGQGGNKLTWGVYLFGMQEERLADDIFQMLNHH